ncbi:hypothetical protein B0J13DRAFT_608279 [Dactylonectria estremocensis]|uniref:Uncharacterized protein n=1 Tax=Dactylonectria estremocensis TaxID=1079267 RepID=A0A9P9EP77_9HYPO|nr:hypothetical protein B0J13DRAFT_608279 [Dactylonectria estremocensis]
MPRCRLSSRRRKKARRLRNALRDACIDVEDQGPQVSPDTLVSDPTATTTPILPTPPTSNPAKPKKTFTALNSNVFLPRPKRKPCKHRRLPDRNYYHRVEDLDYRYLAFQRRIQRLVDEKIKEGKTQIGRWKDWYDSGQDRFVRGLDNKAAWVQQDIRVTKKLVEGIESKLQGMEQKLEDMEKRVTRIVGRFERLEERLEDRLRGYDQEIYGT